VNRRELITQLLQEGDMDDEMMAVNQNASADDDEVAQEITTATTPDEGRCYIYVNGDEE